MTGMDIDDMVIAMSRDDREMRRRMMERRRAEQKGEAWVGLTAFDRRQPNVETP